MSRIKINRASRPRLFWLLLFASIASAVGSSCSSSADTETIRYATIGDPKTLDRMKSAILITATITAHVFEGLFTLDSQFRPKPMLAESFRVEDEGLRWVIGLRRGVFFHNGQEMTSDDVVASLNRWGRVSEGERVLSENLAGLASLDRYTIELRLKRPMPIVPALLAVPRVGAAIYPKQIVDAAGDHEVTEYVGTGPYKFVSWKPDEYIELARFDRYQPRTESPDGMSGKREAHASKIRFIPVRDVQQRLQGVQTGLYDYAEEIPPDLYPQVRAMNGVEPTIVRPYAFPALVLNKKQGLFSNLKIRQAVQAVVDSEAILRAAFGDPTFYELNPGIFPKGSEWLSDGGADLYNQKNLAKAKQLLREGGYHGQRVRLLTTREYAWMYKISEVLKTQLESAGMNAAIDAVDYAALAERRSDPQAWDIFTIAVHQVRDPAAFPHWDASFSGWWVNPQKDLLLQKLAGESEAEKRLQLISQFQRLFYEEVPMIKIGDYFLLNIKSKRIHGPGLSSPITYLFNVRIKR